MHASRYTWIQDKASFPRKFGSSKFLFSQLKLDLPSVWVWTFISNLLVYVSHGRLNVARR